MQLSTFQQPASMFSFGFLSPGGAMLSAVSNGLLSVLICHRQGNSAPRQGHRACRCHRSRYRPVDDWGRILDAELKIAPADPMCARGASLGDFIKLVYVNEHRARL